MTLQEQIKSYPAGTTLTFKGANFTVLVCEPYGRIPLYAHIRTGRLFTTPQIMEYLKTIQAPDDVTIETNGGVR